jgi:hypothetical protein
VQSRVDEQVNDRPWCQILELMRRTDRYAYATGDALAQCRTERRTHAQHGRLSTSCERKRVDRLRHGKQIYIAGYEVGDEVPAVPKGVPLENRSKLPGGSEQISQGSDVASQCPIGDLDVCRKRVSRAGHGLGGACPVIVPK